MAYGRRIGFVLALISQALGCAAVNDDQSETPVASSSQALVRAFEIRLPQPVPVDQVVLAANNTLNVGDTVKLLEPNGTRASASNAGTVGTNIGVTAEVRDLWSVANVTLRDRAHVYGSVRSQGSVVVQNQVIVDGSIQQNVALGSKVVTWNADFPTPQSDVIVPLDQTATVTPGGYGILQTQPRSRIIFSQPGAYYFTSLTLEPTSVIELRNSAGPIYIFVSGGNFIYRASQQKQNTSLHNVMFGFLGTNDGIIDAPFVGTLVAQNSKVNVISSSQGHAGAIYAKSIDVAQPNTVITHRAFAPGDCATNRTACSIGLGCADANANGKADCSECPAGSDLTDSDADGTPNCLDVCPVDATKRQPGVCGCNARDVDTDGDGRLDCQDSCPTDRLNVACTTSDNLPPARPVPIPPGTNPVAPVDPNNCRAETGGLTPHPGRNPTSAELQGAFDAVPNTGAACGTTQVVEACELDPAQVTTVRCTSRADCASLGAQYICNSGKPTSCTSTSAPALCANQQLFCGLPKAQCANEPFPSGCTTPGGCACANPSNPGACGCASFDVCPTTGWTGSSGPADPSTYTPIVRTTSSVITSNRQPAPDPVFTDPVNSTTCEKPHNGNCWCKLGLTDPPPFTDGATKDAQHGSGSLLTFNFKPDVRFNVDLRPEPFGDASFTLDAGAAFLARTTVAFFGVRSEQTLIDMGADVQAQRCRFSTASARFKVFGIDFIDLFGNDPFRTDSTSDNPTLAAAGSACSSAFSTFDLAGDRAKKALRDAQVLIQQHRALAANTTFNRTQFCAAVQSPESDFPATNCMGQPVAATINQYVAYYEKRVQDIRNAQLELARKSADFQNALRSVTVDVSINFLNISRNESQEVANFPFFVGPIPVNITVDVGLSYGVQGNLHYRFSPASALALAPPDSNEIVAVSGKLIPAASASLALFAGVGFDVPGFAVKAGIEGRLTLAVIRSNLEAGTGLSVRALEDARPLPSDLDAIDTGSLLLPKRQYEFFLNWFYSGKLALNEVLVGTLNGKVKLKALFFSKTFRKTILHFNSPFSLAEIKLFEGGSRLPGAVLPVPNLSANTLGVFEMQLPFVELRRLTVPSADPTTAVTYQVPAATPLHYSGFCTQRPPA
ncbi:MAG TPA: hypothetical protein VER33_03885 [Polyangiaceae bacterium]|nr:hypothetical protein [Polyangiaceae bacterium]